MSPILAQSPELLAARLRGENDEPMAVRSVSLESFWATRLLGISPAPGHSSLDLGSAWASTVRSWWGMSATWAMVATGEKGELVWRLALPSAESSHSAVASAHLTGARWGETEASLNLAARLGRFPHRIAMAGHIGLGPGVAFDPVLRAIADGDALLMTVAVPVPRSEIEEQLRESSWIEQYLREEFLARPGLERDNHAPAAACLQLIEAARQRSTLALAEGGWWVRTILAASDAPTLHRLRSIMHGIFASSDAGVPEPVRWQSLEAARKLTFLRSEELAALTSPPRREMPGFSLDSHNRSATSSPVQISESEIFSTAAPPHAPGRTLAIGRILDDAGVPRQWLEIPVDDLCRHLLIAGMTGSGKSITTEHLLLALWSEHRVPWMVIEPGLKSAYRRLLRSELGSDLEIWSVGDPRSRRLSLNPLAAPPGIALAEHTASLFAIIASAFELVPPMPEVLATAIERTYERHGWNLAGLVPCSPPPPFAALIDEIDRCSRELGYGAEITGNLRAGLLLRLGRLLKGPLAPEFGASEGPNIADLVARPVVVELSALPDASSQALVSGVLALGLRHHWRLAGESNLLRHALVIEEAHRILNRVAETAANGARVRATEDFANLLAELRGFGTGMIVVDQTPSALIPSVIANTGTKILHRLDHPDDRELAGRAAGLPAESVDLLGSLAVGRAILRSDHRPRTYRLHMPNPSMTYGKFPTPELTKPVAGQGNLKTDVVCLVCGAARCPAKGIGSDNSQLVRRLHEMQARLGKGGTSAWDWATKVLQEKSSTPFPSKAPLCLMLSIGETAGLSAATLTRLHEAFDSQP